MVIRLTFINYFNLYTLNKYDISINSQYYPKYL